GSQQADEPAQGAQRKTVGAGGETRQIRRRPARQGAVESLVVRPCRRGYAEGADQALKLSTGRPRAGGDDGGAEPAGPLTAYRGGPVGGCRAWSETLGKRTALCT